VERLLRALDNERSKGFSNSMGRLQHFDTFLVRSTAPAGTSARTSAPQRAHSESEADALLPGPTSSATGACSSPAQAYGARALCGERCLQCSRAPQPLRRALMLHDGLVLTSAAGRAQHAELQHVTAQAAGYHRRDLDALQNEGRRYAALGPPERRAFVARLASVLAGLQWCGAPRARRACRGRCTRRGVLSWGRWRAHVDTSSEDRLAGVRACQGDGKVTGSGSNPHSSATHPGSEYEQAAAWLPLGAGCWSQGGTGSMRLHGQAAPMIYTGHVADARLPHCVASPVQPHMRARRDAQHRQSAHVAAGARRGTAAVLRAPRFASHLEQRGRPAPGGDPPAPQAAAGTGAARLAQPETGSGAREAARPGAPGAAPAAQPDFLPRAVQLAHPAGQAGRPPATCAEQGEHSDGHGGAAPGGALAPPRSEANPLADGVPPWELPTEHFAAADGGAAAAARAALVRSGEEAPEAQAAAAAQADALAAAAHMNGAAAGGGGVGSGAAVSAGAPESNWTLTAWLDWLKPGAAAPPAADAPAEAGGAAVAAVGERQAAPPPADAPPATCAASTAAGGAPQAPGAAPAPALGGEPAAQAGRRPADGGTAKAECGEAPSAALAPALGRELTAQAEQRPVADGSTAAAWSEAPPDAASAAPVAAAAQAGALPPRPRLFIFDTETTGARCGTSLPAIGWFCMLLQVTSQFTSAMQ